MKKHGSKEIESINSDQPSANESKSLDGTSGRPLSENSRSITKQGWVNHFSSRQQDLLGFGSASKAIFQQQKIMGVGDVAKSILQQQDALSFGSATKVILQQHRMLGIGDVAKTILQQRDTLGIGAAMRAFSATKAPGYWRRSKNHLGTTGCPRNRRCNESYLSATKAYGHWGRGENYPEAAGSLG